MLLAAILIIFFGIAFGIILNPMFWNMFRNAKYFDELNKQLKEYEQDLMEV